jgi:uncharacterized protein YraI
MRYRDLIKINESTDESLDWILSDIKTGRWWPVKDAVDGRRKAHEHGLLDYEVYPKSAETVAPAPKHHADRHKRKFSNPRVEKPVDPDNPFAALAALKLKK